MRCFNVSSIQLLPSHQGCLIKYVLNHVLCSVQLTYIIGFLSICLKEGWKEKENLYKLRVYIFCT